MAHRTRPPRPRHQLLAGLRRRAVDADPRHHLPAHRVRGRAVLLVAGSHRQGHRADPAQRADRAAHRSAVAGEDRQVEPRGADRAAARQPRRAPKASATASRACTKASAAAAAERRARSTSSPASSTSEKRLTARALAQVEMLNQQIAALRRQLAALEEALEASEKKDKDAQAPHRRSRPAAQRRAGAAGAGAVALPLRLLRPAARDSRQPARHPHRRRPLRVPVGSVLRHRPGGAASRRAAPSSTSSPPRCSSWSSKIPRRDRLGAARRRPHRRAADRRPAVPVQLGAVGGARHLGGAVSDQQGHLAAAAGRRRLRRIPADRSRSSTEEAYSRNRRIELKLTER